MADEKLDTITLTQEEAGRIEWRTPVNASSQVKAAAWVGMTDELAAVLPESFIDPDRGANTRTENLGREAGALLVAFCSGAVYAYEDVSEAATDELLAMDSVGRALNQQVKPGRRYVQIKVEE